MSAAPANELISGVLREYGEATVAIAHTREKHRSQEQVLGLVREALGHLGGMGRFVRPGQTVLIKPNQTVYYSAEEGCTTDPLVVEYVNAFPEIGSFGSAPWR